MTPSEWKAEAIRLSFRLASIRESREATRGDVAQAQADFAAHFDALDQVFLDLYADGVQEGRSEMHRRIG
jgi:hypothetical protein